MTTITTVITALATLVLLVLALSFKVITQYERGIVFRLGRLRPIYDPGLHLVVPFLEYLVRIDTRVVTLAIPPQEVITEDNMPVRVSAVALFNVADPVKAVVAVENYVTATSQITQTTLRSVSGRVDLDTALAHRSALNVDLRNVIEKLTRPWDVEVSTIEIKDAEAPEQMQRAVAHGVEAEHECRTKIINARGELQASEELRQAADTFSELPASLQLRYLQTLLELDTGRNSVVIFPLPMDIIGSLLERFNPQGSSSEVNGGEGDEGAGALRYR